MALVLYGIPNCDTVKKARAWLDARGIDHAFHDYKKAGVTAELLAAWDEAVGWESLLNRRGTTFRGLAEADKVGIDRSKALRLMESHPSLIKRPVISDGQRVTVGFAVDEIERTWAQ